MLQRRRRYKRGIASALRTHANVRTGRKKGPIRRVESRRTLRRAAVLGFYPWRGNTGEMRARKRTICRFRACSERREAERRTSSRCSRSHSRIERRARGNSKGGARSSAAQRAQSCCVASWRVGRSPEASATRCWPARLCSVEGEGGRAHVRILARMQSHNVRRRGREHVRIPRQNAPDAVRIWQGVWVGHARAAHRREVSYERVDEVREALLQLLEAVLHHLEARAARGRQLRQPREGGAGADAVGGHSVSWATRRACGGGRSAEGGCGGGVGGHHHLEQRDAVGGLRV